MFLENEFKVSLVVLSDSLQKISPILCSVVITGTSVTMSAVAECIITKLSNLWVLSFFALFDLGLKSAGVFFRRTSSQRYQNHLDYYEGQCPLIIMKGSVLCFFPYKTSFC